jgi:hypothetical protein
MGGAGIPFAIQEAYIAGVLKRTAFVVPSTPLFERTRMSLTALMIEQIGAAALS